MVNTRNNGVLIGSSNGGQEEVSEGMKQFMSDLVDDKIAGIHQILNNLTAQIANLGNGQNRGNQVGRMTRVEFPKFNGDDVRDWVFRCEQFFLLDNIPDEQKVRLISMQLYDKAMLWHRQFIKLYGENVTWNVYKEAIIQRFGTVFDDPMSELKNVKYETTAKAYQDAFDNFLSRVEICEENVVSFYLGGLPQEIEMGLECLSLGHLLRCIV